MRLKMSLGLMVGLSLAACGGDDSSGGGGSFSPGVDSSKVLGTLTKAESDNLCKASESFVNQIFPEAKAKDFSCRFTGIFSALAAKNDTELQAMCKKAYEACLKAPAPKEDPKGADSCDKPSASCKATVGELTACYNDIKPNFDKLLNSIPACDKATMASLSAVGDMKDSTPASCKTLKMKCPNDDLAPDIDVMMDKMSPKP